jgi:hypothetical protein
MSANLHTHLHRSLFALPLLAVGLLATFSSEAAPEPVRGGSSSPIAFTAPVNCAEPSAKVGAAALARMPGDLSPIAARIRCANAG